MNILSITTSSPICGVSILKNCLPVKEITLNNGLTHSETLMPILKQLLIETNLQLNDIDLFVCDIGPGSFTGIRIAVATIKAFNDSLNIPAIGINSLEALSYKINFPNIVCTLIDAKNDNVYCEVFEISDKKRSIIQNASFENIDSFLYNLKKSKFPGPLTFIGTGAICYKEKILAQFPFSKILENSTLSAIDFGIAGFSYIQEGITPELRPFYLKKSEAEQKLEEKQHESHTN